MRSAALLYRLNTLLRIVASVMLYYLFIDANDSDLAKRFAAYSVSLGMASSLEMGLSFSILRGRSLKFDGSVLKCELFSLIYTALFVTVIFFLSIPLFFSAFEFVSGGEFSFQFAEMDGVLYLGLLFFFISRVIHGIMLRVGWQEKFLIVSVVGSILYLIFVVFSFFSISNVTYHYVVELHFTILLLEYIAIIVVFLYSLRSLDFRFFSQKKYVAPHFRQVFFGGSLSMYGAFVRYFITKLTILITPEPSLAFGLAVQKSFEVVSQLSNATYYTSLPRARELPLEKASKLLTEKARKSLTYVLVGAVMIGLSNNILSLLDYSDIPNLFILMLAIFYFSDRLQAYINQTNLLIKSQASWVAIVFSFISMVIILTMSKFGFDANFVMTVTIAIYLLMAIYFILVARKL